MAFYFSLERTRHVLEYTCRAPALCGVKPCEVMSILPSVTTPTNVTVIFLLTPLMERLRLEGNLSSGPNFSRERMCVAMGCGAEKTCVAMGCGAAREQACEKVRARCWGLTRRKLQWKTSYSQTCSSSSPLLPSSPFAPAAE